MDASYALSPSPGLKAFGVGPVADMPTGFIERFCPIGQHAAAN
ncbi:hypothetical protein CHELA1G2_20196 [Hyphomicrobiales bacterium]|nr:hypothetical protein CHELA1G2_20196 [Hyphomicrobiales bacterium]